MKHLTTISLILIALVYFACDTSKKTTKTTIEEGEVIKAGQSIVPEKPNGTIKFAAANDRYSADGTFKNWSFTKVDMKGQNISTLSATIKVDLTSIWEKSEKLTDHLKASDYFNMEKYTTATIDISNVEENADGTYTADMKLNMKGLSQDMKSTFTVTKKKPLHVTGTAMVDRKLFGLGIENTSLVELVEVSYDTDVPL